MDGPNSGFGDRTLHSAEVYAQAYVNDDVAGDEEIEFQSALLPARALVLMTLLLHRDRGPNNGGQD